MLGSVSVVPMEGPGEVGYEEKLPVPLLNDGVGVGGEGVEYVAVVDWLNDPVGVGSVGSESVVVVVDWLNVLVVAVAGELSVPVLSHG